MATRPRATPRGGPPTLLLLHGFTHTAASWNPVIVALERRYPALGQRYRALAPDLRGHGGSADRRPVTLEAVVSDLATLAPARFTLVGYSMGGRIALHVALALPERVQRLILIGASPGIEEGADRTARRAADRQLALEIEASTISDFARRWATTPVLAGAPPAVAAAAHEDRLRSTPAGLAAALRGLGSGELPPLWGRLREIAMPVSILVGERDEKLRAIAQRMAPELPQADVVIVPGAGHATHLEAPEQVAAILAPRTG